MFDFSSIQYNSENPSLVYILISMVSALLLGIMIAFTYEQTTRTVHRPDSFLQAMILVTVVAATIMQAIGDSVARGLGMLGALSIIRFRTTIRNARNIVFMFGSLGAGIAAGVFGLTSAFIGTTLFCITAFLLRFSPLSPGYNLRGQLKLEIPVALDMTKTINKIIKKYSQRNKLVGYKVFTGIKKHNYVEYSYDLKLRSIEEGNLLVNEIKSLSEEISVATVNFTHSDFDEI